MTEYCAASDVQNRLKQSGYLNATDDDLDDVVSASEVTRNVTSAVAEAGTVMDEYFVNRAPPYVPSELRASGNAWCKYCCVDIAAWFVCTNGGRDAPTSIQDAYEKRLERLEKIEEGNVIPDTTIDTPYSENDHTPFEIASLGMT